MKLRERVGEARGGGGGILADLILYYKKQFVGKQQRRSNQHYVILSETWDIVLAQWESTTEVHAHAYLCADYEHNCALYVQTL